LRKENINNNNSSGGIDKEIKFNFEIFCKKSKKRKFFFLNFAIFFSKEVEKNDVICFFCIFDSYHALLNKS